MIVPPLPWDRPKWRNGGGERVVLLHGLWRSVHAMDPLARALTAAGFSTCNLPYPSTRMTVDALARRVREEIARFADGGPVHLVTHSLGGILARKLLADEPPWTPGRLVMLAPPNHGSEIVDWSAHHPLLRKFLGPAGRSLGCAGLPPTLPNPCPHVETAIIMGRRAVIPFFRKMLDPDNDGIVSAKLGQLPGARGFAVIDADHTFIQLHPECLRRVVPFLKSGAWKE